MTDTFNFQYRHLIYQTRAIEVFVHFAEHAQTVETLEGPVSCQAGDAILTGIQGEQWPVPAAAFPNKYRPADDQQLGQPGRYVKQLARVRAVQLKSTQEIQLPGNRGTLQGKAGDWCVWYGPDDAAIVARDIFCESYELATIPVFIGLGNDLSPTQREQVRGVAAELNNSLLPNTPLICIDETDSSYAASPLWIRVAQKTSTADHTILPLSDISVEAFGTELPNQLDHMLRSDWFDYSLDRLKRLLPRSDNDSDATFADQLAATEQFNASLMENHKLSGYYIEHQRDLALEPKGLERFFRIGEIADHLAGKYQEHWQRLVLATTKEIANIPTGAIPTTIGLLRLIHPRSLTTLGLFVALVLTSLSDYGWGALVAYLALLFAWWCYAQSKAERWEAKHQDYRLLAECLRVFYIRSLLLNNKGINCVVEELPVVQRTESGWVRLALRSLFHAQPLQPVANAKESTAMQWVEEGFIQHQLKYHDSTLFDRREKAIKVLSKIAGWGFRLFLIAMLILGLDALITTLTQQEKAFLSDTGKHWVTFAQVAGLAFWGAMNKVMDVFGLEQEIQRGELVLHALQQAKGKNSSDKYLEAAGYFLRDQEAWHALHRSKPVEAVTG